jgi:hypothetical protein
MWATVSQVRILSATSLGGSAVVNNDTVAKLATITVVMIALTLWMTIDRSHRRLANLPTDFSASRRQTKPSAQPDFSIPIAKTRIGESES